MGTPTRPGVWELLGLGAGIAACVVGGIGIGWLVDWAVGTVPVFMLIGLCLGIAAGVLMGYGKIRSYLS